MPARRRSPRMRTDNIRLGNGARIHAEALQPPDAGQAARRPVLVFLHEGLGSTRMWKGFPQALCDAAGCEGLLFDRQGHGQSDPQQQPRTIHYLHRYALEELPQVLAQAIPERDYIVIGHSDGGSIGLLHAAERPARLRGLITLAAHIYVEDVTLQGIRDALDAWHAGKLRGLARYHGDRVEQVFMAWNATWLTPAFAHWNMAYALPAISVPTCVMQGAGDQYATVQHMHDIAAGIHAATDQLLPDCGHSPHLENPEATLQAMQQVLQDWGVLA